jgi:surface protein
MSQLKTILQDKQQRYKQSGIKEIFKDENGAIDLASIMVGVLVIGLIGGVIASTVFAVIPWAQDNAAKQQLDSIVQAENAYYGLSAATPSPLPAGYMVNSFANSADLEKANLLKTNARYCAVTTNGGKGYEGYSQSGSGKIWKVTNGDVSPSAFTGTLPSDCTFITAGFDTTPAPVVPYVDPTPTKFIMTYQCDATTQIMAPITGSVSGTYTWSDGTTSLSNSPKSLTGGVKYTLIFEGTFSTLDSSFNVNATAGAKCIRSVDHWGTATATTSAYTGFKDAVNLTNVPANIPATVTNMSYIFSGVSSLNDADVKNWDVSKVTNMSYMFNGATVFNQDVSNWNTANVTDMSYMFNGATAMNSALNSWNTLKVTNMERMFYGASSFNQPLDKWVTTNVTNMLLMFYGAPYSQDLTTWDMNKITKMGMMLNNPDSAQLPRTTHPLMFRVTYQCDATTQIMAPIDSASSATFTWSDGTTILNNSPKSLTGGVKYTLIFEGTFSTLSSSFNVNATAGAKCIRSVDHWGSATATTSAYTGFKDAVNLTNVPANIPATVTNMSYIFSGVSSLNDADVKNWDVSKVTNMSYMFNGATVFNQDVSNWNTANVTDMSYMFNGATAMNSALNSWNTLKVTNMERMFYGASSFNQPLDKWVTTNVTNMLLMFYGAPYSQDLTTWDMNKITKMGMMLNNPDSAQLPRTTHPLMFRVTYQCDATTQIMAPIDSASSATFTWSDGTTILNNSPKSLTGGVKYTLIFEGTFSTLSSSFNVNATAGAKCIRSVDHWGSATATTSAYTGFKDAVNLTNVPANVPATVTNMSYMFSGASSFNDSDVKNWDVSKVTNMSYMFSGATVFNQDLSGWNTAAVTNGTFFAPASFPDAYMPAKTSK